MVLDFTTYGRHLIVDKVVTPVYMNLILAKVAMVLGFTAKKAEDPKLKAAETSAQPVAASHGGRHPFVPFAIEDGGRIGAHGHAVFMMLEEHAVAKGRLPPRARHSTPPSPPVAVSLWVRMWQQRLSTWLDLTLTRQILRYLAPSLAHGARFS